MSRFTRRTVLKLSAGLAAGGLAAAGCLWRNTAAWHVAVRRPEVPGGFHPFRLRQSGGAEGRAHRDDGAVWYRNQNPNTFNTLNSYVNPGDAPPRMELIFDTLMMSAADEPDSLYGLIAEAVEISDDERELRFFLRDTPRFHDGSPLTAEDVAFSSEHPEGERPPLDPLGDLRDDRRRGRGRARSAGAHERQPVARREAGRRRAADLLEGLPFARGERHREVDADAAARLRSLQGRQPLGRSLHRIRARRGLLGRRPAGERAGATTSTSSAWSSTASATAGFEAFKKGEITFRQEFDLEGLGDGIRVPVAERGPRAQDNVPGREAGGCAGALFQHAAPAIRGQRRRGGRSGSPSTSSGSTPTCFTASTSAPSRTSSARNTRPPACPRPRSWRCSSRSAPSCRRRCSASPTSSRSRTAPVATAGCSAKRRAC